MKISYSKKLLFFFFTLTSIFRVSENNMDSNCCCKEILKEICSLKENVKRIHEEIITNKNAKAQYGGKAYRDIHVKKRNAQQFPESSIKGKLASEKNKLSCSLFCTCVVAY